MILSTLNTFPNRDFEIIGIVEGSTVQSKHIGKDFGASFKTIVGGELKGYTEMLEQARKEATDRAIQQALSLNADAIIGIHYSSSTIMQGSAEILCYGTAIKFI